MRFRIGKQYAKVGGANLALLAVFAPFDGIFGGFGAHLYADTAASFARRRQGLQKFSLRTSRLDLLLNAAIAALTVNA